MIYAALLQCSKLNYSYRKTTVVKTATISRNRGTEFFRLTTLRLPLRTDAGGVTGGEVWQHFWHEAVRNMGPVYFVLGIQR